MSYKTGADTVIALKVAGTFGTAVTCTTGDRLEVESLSQSKNPEALTANPIGSGDQMTNETRPGAIDPTISIEKIAGYNDAGAVAMAIFMGSDTAGLISGTAYNHSLLHNETFNSKWGTLAMQTFAAGSATNNVFEYPSCAVKSIKVTTSEPPSYAKLAFELIANNRVLSGVNTSSGLDSCTVADTDRVIFNIDSDFWINAQAGAALSSSNLVSILSAELMLNKDQKSAREARGSGAVGNGQPIPSGTPPYVGTLTVKFKSLDDATYFASLDNNSEWKCSLTITGPNITGTAYKRFLYHIPRMKVIADPNYNLTTPAVNDYTVTFTCLVAASTPLGMIDKYPYFVLTNTRSSSLLT